MAGENLDENQDDLNGEQHAVDETGFDDGFADAHSATETPTNVDPQQTTPEQPAAKAAQITEEQFNELLARANALSDVKAETQRKLDQAFGQIGGLKQVIEKLQGGTKQGQPVEVSAEDVSEMREEFPELADLMLKSLQKVAGKFRGTAGAPDVDRLINERVEKTQSELIDSRLDEIVDGDWKAEVASPGFKEWFEKQDASIKSLSESTSVRDAATMLRAFAKSKNTASVSTPKPTARQNQLAAAINPKSSGAKATVTTDEDEFDAGFRSR
jgi:uncharacterized protein YoxC